MANSLVQLEIQFNRNIIIHQDGALRAEVIKEDYLPTINKAAATIGDDSEIEVNPRAAMVSAKPDDTAPVRAFLEGKHCLTGVSVLISNQRNHILSCVLPTHQFIHRAPAGGNTNFVMVATFDNSTWTNMVRRR